MFSFSLQFEFLSQKISPIFLKFSFSIDKHKKMLYNGMRVRKFALLAEFAKNARALLFTPNRYNAYLLRPCLVGRLMILCFRRRVCYLPRCCNYNCSFGSRYPEYYPTLLNFILEEITMFEKLKELLVDELQIDEADITMDAELSGDLGINSIELADLVMLCEEKFNIEIEDGDLHKLVTVGDVVNYLESL